MTLYSPYFMGKKILIMKILCCALFILFSATSVVAQKFTKSEVKDLFLAAISYHAVARVCGEAGENYRPCGEGAGGGDECGARDGCERAGVGK